VPSFQIIIALILFCLGFIVSFDGSFAASDCFNGSPSIGLARLWIAELCTPRLAFSKFQALLADKETAQNTIESVDFVDSNYAGKYLSVKLRKDSNFYRVCSPQICSVKDPYSLDVVKRLGSFGISVGFAFQCL